MEKKSKREQALLNFKKAQTHISKIVKMIEEGKYCIDVMQQNLAVIGLLKSAHQMLMENHLNTCFKEAIKSNNKKKENEMVEEIVKVMKMGNK
jgi:CsoR family transcriptional regulator, copper-sensing transcriptional repressor